MRFTNIPVFMQHHHYRKQCVPQGVRFLIVSVLALIAIIVCVYCEVIIIARFLFRLGSLMEAVSMNTPTHMHIPFPPCTHCMCGTRWFQKRQKVEVATVG